VVVMLLGFAFAYPEAPETERRGAVVAIESRNDAFSTTSLTTPRGQVTVVLTNHDLFWHTFTIDELHVDLEAPMGGTREVTSPHQRGLPVLLPRAGTRRGRHARHLTVG
jgi:hypothetical protein